MADRRRRACFVERRVLGFLVFAGLALSAPPVTAALAPTRLLSLGDPGVVSDTAGGSSAVAASGVSADGRFVVFASSAGNLVAGQVDANSNLDIFLFDRDTGTSTLVSHAVGSPATEGNAVSTDPVLSADGRWVAFLSQATDLVAGQVDTAGSTDLFLYDRLTGINLLASHQDGLATTAAGEAIGPVISADGAFVAYTSPAVTLIPGQTGNGVEVFLFDRAVGTNTMVSHNSASATTVANQGAYGPTISGDGRYVAFYSSANDLVAGQVDPPSTQDVFLYDRMGGTNVLVSHTSAGVTTAANFDSVSPVLSSDGNTIVFTSSASNLATGSTDSNTQPDVFVYDRAATTVSLISKSAFAATTAAGASTHPAVSADGRYVAFVSTASDLGAFTETNFLEDVFLYDRTLATMTLVSRTATAATTTGNGPSTAPSISADGRFVAFQTLATDLTSPAAADSNQLADIYLFDRTTGIATLVSSAFDTPNGTAAGESQGPVVSADGSRVAFFGTALDFVATALDLNGNYDVFLFDRATGTHTLVSRRDPALPSLSAAGISTVPLVSDDGRTVAFLSSAVNLIPGVAAAPGSTAVYWTDPETGAVGLASPSGASPSFTANGSINALALSRDGQRIAYASTGTNLVPAQVDTNGQLDVFLHDRATAATVLVSHRAGFPKTAATAATSSPGNLDLSTDGRYLAYASAATDLVTGQVDANGDLDIFLFDRTTGANVLVSHAAGTTTTAATAANGRSFGPRVSRDGRYVAYTSDATNLVAGLSGPTGVNVYLWDRQTGATTLVTHPFGLSSTRAGGQLDDLTPDGRWLLLTSDSAQLVAGQSDTNFTSDAFLWDRTSDETTLVSHPLGLPTTTGDGNAAGESISADGRFATWQTNSQNIFPGQPANTPALFLFDRTAADSTFIDHGFGYQGSKISADGNFVVYLRPGTPVEPTVGSFPLIFTEQLYLYDRQAATITLVSHTTASDTTQARTGVYNPAISADGAAILFGSRSADLVAGDYNDLDDVFLAANPRPGAVYYTLSPCRLFDSRMSGPALTTGTPRVIPAHGLCGIPSTARAVSANITVTQPTGSGYLTLHPADAALPYTSNVNYSSGQTRSNNAVLPLSFDGLGEVQLAPFTAGGATVQVIVDVTGYFE